jgi:hypothetical protein
MEYHPGKWCGIYGGAAVKREQGENEIQRKDGDESTIYYCKTDNIGQKK